MKIKKNILKDNILACNVVIRWQDGVIKKLEEDIRVLNKSLDIMTEERDKWKAIAEEAEK